MQLIKRKSPSRKKKKGLSIAKTTKIAGSYKIVLLTDVNNFDIQVL